LTAAAKNRATGGFEVKNLIVQPLDFVNIARS
jgi:hypothetical protein